MRQASRYPDDEDSSQAPVRQAGITGRPAIGRGQRVLAVLAALGLVVAAVATATFWNDPLAFGLPAAKANGSLSVAGATAVPSNQVVTNPDVAIAGSVVFEKAGNLWVQSGTETHELTKAGTASMPAWAPDGTWIYYVATATTTGRWPPQAPSDYVLTYPILMRIHPDGTNNTQVLSSLITRGGDLKYFYWLREPAISPDGTTAAVISDGPDPSVRDTVLQFVDLTAGKLLPLPNIAETAPLGHTSPAYRHDGGAIAFVMEGRTATGAAQPSIWIYDPATRLAHRLSQIGYRSPSWSPDGRFIAATRDVGGKLDVAILDATTGQEVARVTTDGASFSPAWSPAGDALLYLHMSGAVTDMRLVKIAVSGDSVTKGADVAVTENTGIDPASRPAWYIPAG